MRNAFEGRRKEPLFLFKLIRKTLCVVVLLAAAFVFVSLKDGGDWFRKAGNSAKNTGEVMGKTADTLKKTVQGIQNTSDKASEALKETSRILKNTGDKVQSAADKVVDTARRAGDKIKEMQPLKTNREKKPHKSRGGND